MPWITKDGRRIFVGGTPAAEEQTNAAVHHSAIGSHGPTPAAEEQTNAAKSVTTRGSLQRPTGGLPGSTEGARVSHPDHLSQSGTPHTGSSAGLVVGGKHYPAGDMHTLMTNVPALHKQLLSQGFKEDFAAIDNRGEGINTTTRSYTHPTLGTVTFDHTGNGQGRHQVLLNLEDMHGGLPGSTEGARVSHPDHLSQSGAPHASVTQFKEGDHVKIIGTNKSSVSERVGTFRNDLVGSPTVHKIISGPTKGGKYAVANSSGFLLGHFHPDDLQKSAPDTSQPPDYLHQSLFGKRR